MTASALIDDYQNAYRAFFAEEPPPVRKLKNGEFNVRFTNKTKRYCEIDFVAETALMLSLKYEVA